MITESSKVVRRYKAGYEIREEVWKLDENDPEPTTMRAAYTPSGDYIGNSKSAHRLVVLRGIKPEKSNPEHCVCSIGFCEKEQKWYGWSHRAIYGFGIGSTVKKGDCAYVPKTPQELYDEITAKDEDGWQCTSPDEVEIVDNGVKIITGHFDDGTPTFYNIECGKGEWTAKTLEDAKIMAIDFANGVS